jgi:uncharacterized protein with beta-barrel porin domain
MARNLQNSVGGASGDWAQFLFALDTLPNSNALGDVLDEISPEPYANATDLSRASINQHRGAVTERLLKLRSTAWLSDSDQRYASNALTDSGPVLADVPAGDEDTWGAWVSGQTLSADQDADEELEFEYDTTGFAAGADVAIGDNFTVGLSGGMANTDVEYDAVGSEIDVDTWHVGLYAGFTGERFFVDAAVSYA